MKVNDTIEANKALGQNRVVPEAISAGKTGIKKAAGDACAGEKTFIATNSAEIHSCPECGSVVEHEGGCVICRNCGFSKCG